MISVIIPVYNAEKYIDNCLRSVLTQKNAEFEVILINDGSTDQTSKRCERWIREYKNVRYIEQENQGQGSARNCGIHQAQGAWLVFLDADDELVPGALHKLQEVADKDADIICYEFFLRRRFGGDEDEHIRLFDGTYRSNSDLIRESTTFLWDKMFRTEFWKKEKITLENIYGEDLKTVYLLEALCEQFVFLREPLVRHFEREDNLSADPERVIEITSAIDGMLNEFIDRDLFECYKVSLFFIVCRQYDIYQCPDFCTFESGQLKNICKELENILNTYFAVCCEWLKVLKETELVLIGYQCRFWYKDESLFKQIAFFPEMEYFFIADWKSKAESVLYMIDLSQEGRCKRFGTRTDKWQKQRWKELADDFFQAVHQSGKLIQVLVFEGAGSDNQELYQLLMKREDVRTIPRDVPVLELLISKEVLSEKIQKEEVRKSGKTNLSSDFWSRGEQYRLQFNENILNAWLMLKNRNKKFEDFFVQRGYQNIAVYGMGYLGERFLEELKTSKVNVKYGIDREVVKKGDLLVYTMEDELPKADVIIVTVVHLFFNICYELKKRQKFR